MTDQLAKIDKTNCQNIVRHEVGLMQFTTNIRYALYLKNSLCRMLKIEKATSHVVYMGKIRSTLFPATHTTTRINRGKQKLK